MSVTTTSNAQTYTLRNVLAEYDLHHTPETDPLDTTVNSHPAPSSATPGNPTHWPTDARRVPPYRPVNRHLDLSERRVYQNNIEWTFVNVMFTGVFAEATVSKIWHATLGRFWDVGYAKGGEW